MSSLFRFFIFCLLLPATASAQHVVMHQEINNDSGGLSAWLNIPSRLDLHLFQAADFRLQIIDNGDFCTRYKNIQEAMQLNQCVAGVNGGFFGDTEERRPLGLLISDSSLISPITDQGFIAAGVVYDTGTGIKLERRKKLSTPIKQMKQAIQSGPFLVEDNKRVSGLNKTRRARRTFIATDGKNTWCLGCSTSLTLHELATWLTAIKLPNGNPIHAALNLDGGTSSSYWNATDGTHVPAFRNVRNYVGIRPRNAH